MVATLVPDKEFQKGIIRQCQFPKSTIATRGVLRATAPDRVLFYELDPVFSGVNLLYLVHNRGGFPRLLDEKNVHGLWEILQSEDSGTAALRRLYQPFSRQRVSNASIIVI